jgi:lipoprotein signal peptidase
MTTPSTDRAPRPAVVDEPKRRLLSYVLPVFNEADGITVFH